MWFLIVNLEAKTETRVAFNFATEDLNWTAAENFGRLLLGDQFLCAELDSDDYPDSPVVSPPAEPVRVRRLRKSTKSSTSFFAGSFR